MTALVVGARGQLGNTLARRLLSAGHRVRASSRTPERLEALRQLGAEVAFGELREPASLGEALRGVEAVLDCAHAFGSDADNSSLVVDEAGKCALIDLAAASGVGRYVFVSVVGAAPDHPIDFQRGKARVEAHLRGSSLPHTVLRATAFMDSWAGRFGPPILRGEPVTLWGSGRNPINFVAVDDVAEVLTESLEAPPPPLLTVGGPQDLSLLEVVQTYAELAGLEPTVRHVPVAEMEAELRHIEQHQPHREGEARRLRVRLNMEATDQRFREPERAVPRGRPLLTLRDLAERQMRQLGLGSARDISP